MMDKLLSRTGPQEEPSKKYGSNEAENIVNKANSRPSSERLRVESNALGISMNTNLPARAYTTTPVEGQEKIQESRSLPRYNIAGRQPQTYTPSRGAKQDEQSSAPPRKNSSAGQRETRTIEGQHSTCSRSSRDPPFQGIAISRFDQPPTSHGAATDFAKPSFSRHARHVARLPSIHETVDPLDGHVTATSNCGIRNNGTVADIVEIRSERKNPHSAIDPGAERIENQSKGRVLYERKVVIGLGVYEELAENEYSPLGDDMAVDEYEDIFWTPRRQMTTQQSRRESKGEVESIDQGNEADRLQRWQRYFRGPVVRDLNSEGEAEDLLYQDLLRDVRTQPSNADHRSEADRRAFWGFVRKELHAGEPTEEEAMQVKEILTEAQKQKRRRETINFATLQRQACDEKELWELERVLKDLKAGGGGTRSGGGFDHGDGDGDGVDIPDREEDLKLNTGKHQACAKPFSPPPTPAAPPSPESTPILNSNINTNTSSQPPAYINPPWIHSQQKASSSTYSTSSTRANTKRPPNSIPPPSHQKTPFQHASSPSAHNSPLDRQRKSAQTSRARMNPN